MPEDHAPENGGSSSSETGQRRRRSSALHAPRRKYPAHIATAESGNRARIVFVTVCTKNRRPLLANDDAMRLIIAAWEKATFWKVGRYVIMPDHIHFFCAPNAATPEPLEPWMRFWRTDVTKHWPNCSEVPIWQRDYWDRQLRSGDSYSAKWIYVTNNPVRHGLVQNAEDWPYKGELNPLAWHD